ncbi:Uncharacterised protein [uncultured archaeon]|nr:Uncharacterised protein [uncultured archaeon]
MLAVRAKREHFLGSRIYANFHLNLDNRQIDFATRRKENDLNYTPVFTPEDLSSVTSGSSIFIDELDVLGVENPEERGVDSYSYRNESSTLSERFLKKRLRKKNCSIWYTIQQLNMVPTRIRAETLNVFEPIVVKSIMNEHGEIVPYIIHYRERYLNNITGMHDLTPDIKILSHPIFGYSSTPHPKFGVIKYVTPDMLSLYDTMSEPFRPSDKFSTKAGFPKDRDENFVYPNEKAVCEALKKALPQASIIPYPRSGLGSKRAGDIEIKFPVDFGLPTIIVEVKGADKFGKDGDIRSISTQQDGKGMNWSDALAFDGNFNTVHVCAFRNHKTEEIFVFGIKENFEYINGKKKVALSKLEGVMTLKDFTNELKKARVKVTAGESILKNKVEPRQVAKL